MDRETAREESRKRPPGSRSLKCIWYCGIINGEIKKATKMGEMKLEIVYPPKHYVVLHRETFMMLYRNEGYRVSFEPNFKHIQPTEWRFTISWE